MSILRVESLSVRYGGVRALCDVDLEVQPGELVGLIGPNGAGKTTLIDAITGFAPSTGRVWLEDTDISRLPAHQRARAGVGRTFQAAELFDDLTVSENVGVPRRRTLFRLSRELVTGRRTRDECVDQVLARVGLEQLCDALPEELSHAQRNLVGVARALAAEPRLLLLDEPAAGLDTAESAELGRRLRALADDGQSVMLVDHDMSLVLAICDRVVVLDVGAVIADATPAEIQADTQVRSAYLGSGHGTAGRAVKASDARDRDAGEPLLEVNGLMAGYGAVTVLRDVTLSVHAGEVVALLGPNGAGKTTLLRAVSRLVEPLAGTVRFGGVDVSGTRPHLLARQGLVHVPEDRGIFSGLTVAEHFRAAPGGGLDFGLGIEYFPQLADLRGRRAGLLSGGEQQMLALALALARRPRLLLLDEMSMGLAPLNVQRMLPVVRAYAETERAGVLLVEQHVPLALGLAEHAYVLAHGEIVLDGSAAALGEDTDALMASYLGEPATVHRTQRKLKRGEGPQADVRLMTKGKVH